MLLGGKSHKKWKNTVERLKRTRCSFKRSLQKPRMAGFAISSSHRWFLWYSQTEGQFNRRRWRTHWHLHKIHIIFERTALEVCVGRIGRKRDYSECGETKRKERKKRENINVVLEVSIFVVSRMMSSSPSSLRPFTKYNPSVLSKPTFQRAKFFRNFNPVSNINQFS